MLTNPHRVLFFPLLASVLSACTPVAYRSTEGQTPPPVVEPKSVPAPAAQQPLKPAVPSKPRAEAPRKSAPPAVAALMQEAENSRSAGQLDNAAATLERAIRIQPRNAELWQQLATVRLQQGQPGIAEDLAKKSNVLARGNRTLSQKNWTLIAEARRLKGDAQGAADAEAKAAGQ